MRKAMTGSLSPRLARHFEIRGVEAVIEQPSVGLQVFREARMMSRWARAVSITTMIIASMWANAASGSGYQLLKKILVPGTGGWDYLAVDSEARRLYVSHGTRVEVIDLETDKVIGQIPDT